MSREASEGVRVAAAPAATGRKALCSNSTLAVAGASTGVEASAASAAWGETSGIDAVMAGGSSPAAGGGRAQVGTSPEESGGTKERPPPDAGAGTQARR